MPDKRRDKKTRSGLSTKSYHTGKSHNAEKTTYGGKKKKN